MYLFLLGLAVKCMCLLKRRFFLINKKATFSIYFSPVKLFTNHLCTTLWLYLQFFRLTVTWQLAGQEKHLWKHLVIWSTLLSCAPGWHDSENYSHYEFLTWKVHVGRLPNVGKRSVMDLTFGLVPDIAQSDLTLSSVSGVSNTQAGAAWRMNHTDIFTVFASGRVQGREQEILYESARAEMHRHWELCQRCAGMFHICWQISVLSLMSWDVANKRR